jgi:hypothetical protein
MYLYAPAEPPFLRYGGMLMLKEGKKDPLSLLYSSFIRKSMEWNEEQTTNTYFLGCRYLT